MKWCQAKSTFPSILLLRRYIKLIARYCDAHEMLDTLLADALKQNLPFKLELLPYSFPALNTLVMWIPIKS